MTLLPVTGVSAERLSSGCGTPQVVAVVGPTATGKTDLSLSLAEALDAEVVSVDVVQLYKGLDVGTAKAPAEARRRVPHHMVDVLEPWEDSSAGWFRQEARKSVVSILAKGRSVVMVGGSGLYFTALTTDLPLHPSDQGRRARIERMVESAGLEEAVRYLNDLAPQTARSIDTSNPRRVVRALEIATALAERGKDPDGWYSGIDHFFGEGFPLIGIGLDLPRSVHRMRVRERTLAMFSKGLVDEVCRTLLDSPRPASATVQEAVGYRQVLERMRAGRDPKEAVDEIVAATVALARRQRAWFRRDPRVVWFVVSEPDRARASALVYVSEMARRKDTGSWWVENIGRQNGEMQEARSA